LKELSIDGRDILKTVVKEIGFIHVVHYRDQWRPHVNTVISHRVSQKLEHFLTAERLVISQVILFSMEFIVCPSCCAV
jgi:hypothetical protein